MDSSRVAIVGLGIAGLVSLKDLREIGLDAVGFEQDDHIGGLWQYNEDPERLSVIHSTHTNGSKHFVALSDYPLPPDSQEYPDAPAVARWLDQYAAKHDLLSHCHLRTKITFIAPTSPGAVETRWRLTAEDARGQRSEDFDKVIVATGPFQKAWMPAIPGVIENEAMVIHSKAYKNPEAFRGKRVVVIGTGNTACDICVELAGVASKVYVAARSGQPIFKKIEPPVDGMFTRKQFYDFGQALQSPAAADASKAAGEGLRTMFEATWPEYDLEKFGLVPFPPLVNTIPILNDNFIPAIGRGQITPIGPLQSIASGKVQLASGENLPCDIVIAATGGMFEYPSLHPDADPTNYDHREWHEAQYSEGLDLPKLFQGIFHPVFSHSLAFIGPVDLYSLSVPSNYDLAACAIAQVFSGRYQLPPAKDIAKWCDEFYRQELAFVRNHRVPKIRIDQYGLEHFLNEAAGNEVNEYMKSGPKHDQFIREDLELFNLIMEGKPNPFVYRLFDGRPGSRRRWPKARQAILWANGMADPPDF